MKNKITFALMLAIMFALPAVLMVACKSRQPSSPQPGSAAKGTLPRPQGPCDIYAAASTPCVAAHSTTRALSAAFNGPLYQVMRQSDGKTLDIGVVQSSATDAGGYADAAAQDAFCANTICFIKLIYDQSGKSNHLYQAPPGTFKGPAKGGFNTLPIADMAPITIGGHKAYGVYIIPGMGFRNNNATGIAINDEPEGVYSIVDGKHYDSGCCFDYGNAETDSRADGPGTMETTYFGTATTWGTGSGPGPWIEADFEGGVFSGYNAKQNAADPTITSWRFVTAVVDGGGGNKWDLRGGNAQQGALTTFYSGVRPGSSNSASYFPMHKQGAVLLGTGGDNGNGSSGTFYEGAITTGYPPEAATDALQANIVAAKYDVERVSLSRLTTFAPGSSQNITVTFNNTTAAPAATVKLTVSVPKGWTSTVSGTNATSKTLVGPFAPGAGLNATFKITSPATTSAGFLAALAAWTSQTTDGPQSEMTDRLQSEMTDRLQSETTVQRVRSALPVKINEVRFGNQFIELYNASETDADISNWTLINTPSQWASVKLATIPPRTKLAPHAFYLLALSSSGLAAPATPRATTIHVRATTGFEAGQKIDIEGESRTIATVGTPASPMTTVFVPVSTGPWLTFPAGATNLPVTSAAGFEVGQKIGMDIGGNYEMATVTAVGKAATQTTLSAQVVAGATNIKITANSDMLLGDTLTIGTGGRKETLSVKRIVSVSAAPVGRGRGGFGGGGGGGGGEIELSAPLKFDHMLGDNVSDAGTGITFSPPTRFPHLSGEAVQALGTGITLDRPLLNAHEYGAPIVNPLALAASYQGPPSPDQWFGNPLSASAGSIALLDATGKVIVDALVFGSQQSNSSGNGTIASPDLATLEGNQSQGGCIVVVPSPARGGAGRGAAPVVGSATRSVGLRPDGATTGNPCSDYQLQSPTPGASNHPSQ
jgi:hypothetical protein